MTKSGQRIVASMLLWSVIAGCATTPSIAPVSRGESLSIVVVKSPKAGSDASIHNQALGENASLGGGSGVVVGALYGLTCGPFAVLCVPLGAMAGAVAGTAAGAAVGLGGALSEEKASQVRARLVRLQLAHDGADDLGRDLTERASLQWNLHSAAPTYLMFVELQDVRLTSTRDEHIGFVFSARVSVRPAVAQPGAGTKEKTFEYVGPFFTLAEWLDEGSDVLAGNLGIASRQLALQIVSDLTRH